MSAKEFLRMVSRKRRSVRRMEEALNENIARLEGVSGLKLTEKVQTSTKSTIDMALAALEDERSRLERAQAELGELVEQAKEVINLLRDDELLWQIMWRRYVSGETWSAISASMHYSRTSLYMYERRALWLLEQRLKVFDFKFLKNYS